MLMSHYFVKNCSWITASFTLSRMKDLCKKWKVKLIFWRRLKQSGDLT